MRPETQIESFIEEERQASAPVSATQHESLHQAAIRLAETLSWLPGSTSSDALKKRCRNLLDSFKSLLASVEPAFQRNSSSEDLLWLRNNSQQLISAVRLAANDLEPLGTLPMVAAKEEILPRVVAIAKTSLDEVGTALTKPRFTEFCLAFEEKTPLEYHEIGALVPALKLVILEEIAARGGRVVKNLARSADGVVPYIRVLQHVTQTSWKDELESLIPFDSILREDPAGVYASMDAESRNIYRETVARLAQHSDRSEMEIAKKALSLARKAQKRTSFDPRIALRESHIGYYLGAEGMTELAQRVGYHPPAGERLRAFLRKHPDEFLLGGIAVFTLVIISIAIWLLTPVTTSVALVLLSMLILALPSSQAAVQIMNYLTTNLLPATTLPKMDFSKGVPSDCVTMVAIPTLLLNQEQVHTLIEELEVRYLGNHDRNIHFAIVSDLPDAHQPAPEDDALVALCSKLVSDLNERYAAKAAGTFFHFHRHRVYNPRERGWMGWERKRGKLLDLNQLLRGHFDSFPVKIGNLSILPSVRFVITLDSDTELPRGSAHRMIGALAHPLNQAIVDPVSNIVVAGYGILQPRVGVSVQCTARSRLAAIFAGETGLDPYTRAISDVYQDLYGEGSFTGKGIYEVDTMFQVLYGRFPRNSLLSHDLIEGAYARVGLTTDIVVIEDYPSHYSAYNRRKHRWLRGDWQIVEWLTDRVPDESGARVPNPISLVSRWKILDNLRRSLVEPATFALLLFGWFVMGHPVLWTLATICILFVPAWVEFAFGVTRALAAGNLPGLRDPLSTLFAANFSVFLTLTLLAHQTLLSLDAVGRAIVRRMITRERLLEWETAAEAELGKRLTPVDRYLNWLPLLSVALGALIWWARPYSLIAATPILVLWACSQPLAVWLNSSPIEAPPDITHKDTLLLRRSALHIWRYFAEFSTQEHHWLIPDNVQEQPYKVAPSVSPTNLGLLLNARQAAVEFGYITVPEFADLTRKTLDTLTSLPKYRGHLMNWYDTRTLDPKPPFFISSVDSGNLVASLWTLREGCFDLLRRPLFSRALAEGFRDHLRTLVELRALPKRALLPYEAELEAMLQADLEAVHAETAHVEKNDWLTSILEFPVEALDEKNPRTRDTAASADIAWFREQTRARIQHLREAVRAYMPWRLPEFAALREKAAGDAKHIDNDLPLEHLADLISEMENRLEGTMQAAQNGNRSLGMELRARLSAARENARHLVHSLTELGRHARELGNQMDFSFLLDKQRQLLSVGFDAQSEELVPYCYDLLATEPRTAVFIAIAKEDIPQDCWFHLDRPFTRDHGRPVLMSWTGTMFEYLMPTIWMRSYPNTLLDRGIKAAVRSQQQYAAEKGILWGISESASACRNDAGDYHYEAFGVPTLALQKNESEPLIVSPYSSLLALTADRKAALANLQRMNSLGWFGSYGFYESADYTVSCRRFGPRYELVRQWMVHHQGMSLLSLANFLCDNVVQSWFHADRRVQATELLLQEKPIAQMAEA